MLPSLTNPHKVAWLPTPPPASLYHQVYFSRHFITIWISVFTCCFFLPSQECKLHVEEILSVLFTTITAWESTWYIAGVQYILRVWMNEWTIVAGEFLGLQGSGLHSLLYCFKVLSQWNFLKIANNSVFLLLYSVSVIYHFFPWSEGTIYPLKLVLPFLLCMQLPPPSMAGSGKFPEDKFGIKGEGRSK